MKYFLLAATALVMLCTGAQAQVSTSSSASRSTAINSSASASSAITRSSSVGNNTTINVSGGNSSTTDPSSTTSTGQYQYIGYGGGYTVRNTPDIQPPNVLGGNPCAVGASGGLSVSGFGIAGGATWADRQCERRQQAALLYNMGEPKVALELMCQDDNVRAAMRLSGRPCTTDVAAAQPAAVAAAPVASPTPPVVQVAAAAPVRAEPRPAWCDKAAPTTEASREYVAQVCGK